MRKLRPSALFAALVLCVAGCQTGTTLHSGPYVTNVHGDSATLLWVTPKDAANSHVLVDQAAIVETRTQHIKGQKETLHIASLSHLNPATTYHYMIAFTPDGKLVGNTSGEFHTPPPDGSDAPIKFAVYGDTRTYPARHHEVSSAMDNDGPLDFVVQSGDLVGDGTVWPLWKKQYFDPAHDMLRHTTIWPAQGNHEADGILFESLFDIKKSYYSFDFGNVHFAILNSELSPGKVDLAMLAWLEKDMNASTAEWKFVSYHRPTFDIITHRTTWGQGELLPVLERCGVDVVMSGHTHNYQRFRPIGSELKKPLIFMVSAGGGAPNYPVNPAEILEKGYSGLHYCLFNVNGNTLEMTAKYPDGRILDHFTLVKNDGTYQKEVLDRAVTTKFARESAFLLTGFFVNAPLPPRPGEPITFNINPLSFPVGATVQVASALPPTPVPGQIQHGTWTVPTVTLTGFKGHDGVDEDHNPNKETYAPLTFTAYAPPDFFIGPKTIGPMPRVSLVVTFEGKTYSILDAGVYFRTPTLKSWRALLAAEAAGPSTQGTP